MDGANNALFNNKNLPLKEGGEKRIRRLEVIYPMIVGKLYKMGSVFPMLRCLCGLEQ